MPWDGEVEAGDLFRCTQEYTSPTFTVEEGAVIMVHHISSEDPSLIYIMTDKSQAKLARYTLPRLRLPSLIGHFIFVRSYMPALRKRFDELSCMGLSTAEKFWILHESRPPRKKLKPHGVIARTLTKRADWEPAAGGSAAKK